MGVTLLNQFYYGNSPFFFFPFSILLLCYKRAALFSSLLLIVLGYGTRVEFTTGINKNMDALRNRDN